MTTTYLQSGAPWYYEGLPYKIVQRGLIWCIDGLSGGSYGFVSHFGDTLMYVDIAVFGVMHKMTLLYEDMEPLNVVI